MKWTGCNVPISGCCWSRMRFAWERAFSGESPGTVTLSTWCATVHRQSTPVCASDYDVLVLDINLPDAVGWNVLTALDAADRRPRTIVLSAVPPSAARVREFSPVSVLEKPFPIDALLRLIEHPEGASQTDLPVVEGSNIL